MIEYPADLVYLAAQIWGEGNGDKRSVDKDSDLPEGICEVFYDMLLDYGYDLLAAQFAYCWKVDRRANFCDVPQRIAGLGWLGAGGRKYEAGEPPCLCTGDGAGGVPHPVLKEDES